MTDLEQAIQVGGLALSYAPFNLPLDTALGHARVALTTAWPLIEAEISQLDRARSDLYQELRDMSEELARLQEFEQAIIDAFGQLRWDKISQALITLHTPNHAAPGQVDQ